MKVERYALIGALVVSALLAIDLFSPYSPKPSKPVSLPNTPQLLNVAGAGYLRRMTERNLWDEKRGRLQDDAATIEVDDADQPAVDLSWVLHAVVERAGQRLAVVGSATGVVSQAVGEHVPDGGKIVAIHPYGIEVLESGKVINVFLFGKQ